MKTENEKIKSVALDKHFQKWKVNRTLEERLSSAIESQTKTNSATMKQIRESETFEDSIKALFEIRD